MNLLYVLAQHNFFRHGRRGRVSHAVGFASGVAAWGHRVTVLSGPGAKQYFASGAGVEMSCQGSERMFLWFVLFQIYLFRLARKSDVIVVRWKPLWFLFGFLPLALLLCRKKVWFEVNSFTGADSNIVFVRLLAKVSLALVTRLFSVIVVSEESRRLLQVMCPNCQRIFVVPNGFDASAFEAFSPLRLQSAGLNLVYFGRKQPYYDWDLVFDAVVRINKVVSHGVRLHVFGFNDLERENVQFYGGFESPESLLSQLKALSNLVLILPASDSEIAKAGSPMKLYEYAALGLPIISSSSLAIQSAKLNGVDYYEAGNVYSFVRAVLAIADSYETKQQASAINAYVAENEYSWKAVVSRWLQYGVGMRER